MAKSPIQLLVQRYVEQRDDPLTTQLVVKRQVEQRDGPLHFVLHAPATTNSSHAQALRRQFARSGEYMYIQHE